MRSIRSRRCRSAGTGFQSCPPGGILRLLDTYDVPLTGKHAVVVGRSPILGKPMGMLRHSRDATVTHRHSRTELIADFVANVGLAPAAEVARLITPVPCGVGPMTIGVLLAQTLDAATANRELGWFHGFKSR